MKAGRILEMERYVLSRGSAAMDELAAHFEVSENTIRRDITELIRRGSVRKVYGGVCAKQLSRSLTPYEERSCSNEEAKTLIGKAAASLVKDGDIIVIDIPSRSINVKLTDEELAARPMQPLKRNRVVSKALRAYANSVSSADKGGVRIID